MDHILIAIIPLILGGGGAWFVSKYGIKLRLIDVPNERSSHTKSVPKGGGIGILFTFVFFSLYLNLPFFFWLPAVIVSLLSLLGDKNELSVKSRLFVQIICSIAVLFEALHVKDTHFYLLLPFMILYIAGTANIYNFMDGINGIAGITAVIAFIFLAYYAALIGAPKEYILLCSAMAVSCFAFLFFNIPTAKVFMGDVGSVFIGFVFASMVILLAMDFTDFICMSGFLFLFYFDELTAMIVRVGKKENLTKPHRRHLYQLLVNEMGLTHWKVSFVYGFIQVMVCLTIIRLIPAGIGFVLLSFAVYGLFFALFAVIIRNKAVI
ncbi:MAG: glycosyltransferase family 4 protein [Desulfobacula sp.]|uniref:MraY family glycosyltransferase n=1 Tax=Desulfobacula sp. TaxID=2593537 RepID=UPI0025B82422|nr:glycosyltransferase family 4 protein [Desulfobacula sp.]MCD4722740.1 glycosyltransferase family 4 protein [Desulfobacula sp.]